MPASATIAPSETVVFIAAGQRCGLPCRQVREVHRAVTLAAPIGEHAAVAGHVNLRGQVARVFDLRMLLGQPSRPIRHTDLLIVADSARGPLVLLAERAIGLMKLSGTEFDTAVAHPPSTIGRYVADRDGLVLLLDPDAVLSVVQDSTLPDRGGLDSTRRQEAQP